MTFDVYKSHEVSVNLFFSLKQMGNVDEIVEKLAYKKKT